MNPINRSPENPVSGTEADEVWFPIRVTSVPAVGKYLFQEVWLTDSGLQIADRIGSRSNTATDPAYAIDGSTFAVTAAGSPVQAFARRAPGCGGGNWELIAPGGGPDATLTNRGWVSTTTQQFAGTKTFRDGIQVGLSLDPFGGVTGVITIESPTPFSTPAQIFSGSAAVALEPGPMQFLSQAFNFWNTGDWPTIMLTRGSGAPFFATGQTVNVTIDGTTLHFTSGILTAVT